MYLNNATRFADDNAETRMIRETTIVQYLAHVHALAARLQSRVPPCVALDGFQPSRGLQFGTYARHRIWGAMLDFLRGEDPLSRAERRQVRAASAGRPSAATISLEELPAFEPRSTRCTSYAFTDRVDLERARQRLSAREQQVVSLLFDLDRSNREVARELGVNESRVSQIKHAALSKLRESLRNRNYRRAAA
jgi:RNA polymerase sigma factor (sigma-70 family)